jgi:hypothetical protein
MLCGFSVTSDFGAAFSPAHIGPILAFIGAFGKVIIIAVVSSGAPAMTSKPFHPLFRIVNTAYSEYIHPAARS